jgi:hypothetical protein
MARSKHSLGYHHLTTANLGQFIPIGLWPTLPGDLFGLSTSALVRVTPLAAPVMHQVDVEIRHYYAPNRILWNDNDGTDWEEFITGGEDGMNADTVPTLTSVATAGGLMDHMGIPLVAGIEVNALPFTMYNRIHNELIRDQDLQTTIRNDNDLTIANVNWAGDYISEAKPWSQKGPSVSLPVGDSAPVRVTANTDNATIGVNAASGTTEYAVDTQGGVGDKVQLDTGTSPQNLLWTDLSSATGADPIAFRRAWGLQRFMEAAVKYGSRYPEKMRSLGSNYRGVMERPITIGGGRTTVNFSEVIQTANDTSDRAYGIGDLYGHGVAGMKTGKTAFRADEHGYIMTCMYVRPKPMYMHAIDREFLRQDREDFHDPYLEQIGMQEVWKNEVYAESANTNADVFGYQNRYDEYRQALSKATGEFRSTLDYWHMARKLASAPTLNAAFKEMDGSTAAMKRCFQEQTNDSLWIMANHQCVAHRNVSKRASTRLV